MEPRGLTNLGNSCYLNAAVQALFNLEPFINSCCNEEVSELPIWHKEGELCILRLLHDSIFMYWSSNSTVALTQLFRHVSSINSVMVCGRQEDSWELLASLLDCIHNDFMWHCKDSGIKETELVQLSPVNQIFSSKVTTSVTCISCGCLSSSNLEQPIHFVVNIEGFDSAHESLDAHFSPSVVQSHCPQCSNFKIFASAESFQTKSNNVPKLSEKMLTSSPKILLFSLVRFDDQGHKDERPISVNEYLSMNGALYRVKAFILHHGATIDKGHYTTCLRETDKWFHCDDAQVYEIDSSFLTDDIILKAVYGFAYEKLSTEEVSEDCGDTNDVVDVSVKEVCVWPSKDMNPCEGNKCEEIRPTETEQCNVVLDCGDNNDVVDVSVKEPLEDKNPCEGNKCEKIRPTETEQCDVVLEENEVPGATLPDLPLKKFSKDVLQRWLQCRGIIIRNMKKDDLIKLVEEEMEKGTEVDKNIDGGTWLQTKMAKLESRKSQPHPSGDLESEVIQEEASSIVNLTEDDVHGAKLPNKPYAQITVKEMKAYLVLRGQEVSGRKSDLWERIHKLREAGDSHVLDSAVSNQFYYKQKQDNLLSKAGLTPIRHRFPLPQKGWKPFPSVEVPSHFNEGMAYNYLVERHPNDDSSAAFHTSKPGRRAKKYVDSGFITNVEDCFNENIYFLKSKVRASMNKMLHDAAVVISRHSGFVLYGECDCLASAMGRCNHIAALLQCLWSYNLQPQGVTCTSLPQKWGQGAKRKMPGVIPDTDYPSKRSISKQAHFDPRATGDIFRSATLDFALHFRKSLPSSLLLWNDVLPEDPEDIGSKDTIDRGKESEMEDPLLDIDDPSMDMDVNNNSISGSENNGSTTEEKCRKFLLDLEAKYANEGDLSYVEIPNTQQGTRNWLAERGLAVTSSIAKRTCGLTTLEAKKNFLISHMWREKPILTEAMRYGILNEAAAREEYISIVKIAHPDVQVKLMGLCASKKYPQLRCSPDGIVIFNIRTVLLEIKCPFILQEHNPHQFHSVLSKEQLQRFHLQRTSQGSVEFKINHPYYYQIQFSMGILNIDRCHFVTWSPKGCLINTVDFDKSFYVFIRNKLITRHRRLFVPEIILERAKRGLLPLELHY